MQNKTKCATCPFPSGCSWCDNMDSDKTLNVSTTQLQLNEYGIPIYPDGAPIPIEALAGLRIDRYKLSKTPITQQEERATVSGPEHLIKAIIDEYVRRSQQLASIRRDHEFARSLKSDQWGDGGR